MMKLDLFRGAPLLLVFSLLAISVPASAAREQDAGRQIEQEYGIVSRATPEGRRLNDQMDRVVERIVSAVNATSGKGNFRLRSAKLLGGRSEKGDKVINAFALPDGRIYVMLGLARLVQDSPRADDELAFVVGHEVTHVVEHHSAEQQKKATQAGLLAVILGAVTKNNAVGTLGGYGAAAYVSSFSRKDEYAADKGGLMAMYRANYDPRAAVTMLNRLKAAGGSSNKTVNGWFGSHPLTENRVERVKEMISDLQDGRDLKDRSDRDLDRDDKRSRNRD